VAQHLHDALLVELLDAARNCLIRLRSAGWAVAKCSGVKVGSGGNTTSRPRAGCRRPQVGGVDQPDDVAGEGLVDGLAVAAEHRVGVLGR
jgi:hypothetical protein